MNGDSTPHISPRIPPMDTESAYGEKGWDVFSSGSSGCIFTKTTRVKKHWMTWRAICGLP